MFIQYYNGHWCSISFTLGQSRSDACVWMCLYMHLFSKLGMCQCGLLVYKFLSSFQKIHMSHYNVCVLNMYLIYHWTLNSHPSFIIMILWYAWKFCIICTEQLYLFGFWSEFCEVIVWKLIVFTLRNLSYTFKRMVSL